MLSTGFDDEGMQDDRRLIALDSNGRFLTARAHSKLLHLSCSQTDGGWLLAHDDMDESIEIRKDELTERIEGILWKDSIQALDAGDEAANWLSTAIGVESRIGVWRTQSRFANKYQMETSFSDASPILIASEASVSKASEWAGIASDTRRFRPNIVVDGVAAFAEDGWRHIKIGEAKFEVLDTCVRCILTTIDPDSAERHPEREPMVSLMKYHATDDGQPLFGVNVKLVSPPENLSIAVGDEVVVD